jgi:hypothetical protein
MTWIATPSVAQIARDASRHRTADGMAAVKEKGPFFKSLS